MFKGRFVYALALACAIVFYIFYPEYLSFLILLFVLLLPVLSLLLSIPSRLRASLYVQSSAPWVRRDGTAFLSLDLRGAPGPVTVRYQVENLLYPAQRHSGTLTCLPNAPLKLPLPTGHCGWVKCTFRLCRMTDWMGLFPLPLTPPQPVMVLVAPYEDRLPQGLDLAPRPGAPLLPRPGGGPGEDYDLRPYRPGDPVASIHWKLTAKQSDAPVLRETLEPALPRLVVVYDHFGPPEELDDVLDQLASLARDLLSRERPFSLRFTDPATGRAADYFIDCPQAWDKCLKILCRQAAPRSSAYPAPACGPSHLRFLRLKPTGEEVDRP